MARHFTFSILALALMPGAAIAAPGPDHGFDVAITVDDAPAHATLPPGQSRADVARAFVRAFQRHHVTQPWAFVNAVGIARDPASIEALRIWRAAGWPMGNHTYSHMNLATAPTLQAWTDNVSAGEPVLRETMGAADWRYLRLPNLSAAQGERQQGAFAYLRAQHYRLADVTLGYDDWMFSDAYARCMAKGDKAAIATMEERYRRAIDQQIAWSMAASRRVYGRVIPQVLLIHMGAFTAHMLPDMLARMDRAGARYVPLDRAQADPAYELWGGGNLIARAAGAQGITLADMPKVDDNSDVSSFCR